MRKQSRDQIPNNEGDKRDPEETPKKRRLPQQFTPPVDWTLFHPGGATNSKGLTFQLCPHYVHVISRMPIVRFLPFCSHLTLGELSQIDSRLTSLTYRGASMDWLATHFHVPSRFTQVSVKRNRYWTTWPARLRLS